jgi:hypothetical protein
MRSATFETGERGCLYGPAYPGLNEVWRILSNWNTYFSPKQKLDNFKYCLNEIRNALKVMQWKKTINKSEQHLFFV